ncbi:MAG TPA: cysteine rich repeat-containing protein [Pseudolabrys sp.]|nr:cysteine rich repeat-containing protein [Pseudolabrys sp.]
MTRILLAVFALSSLPLAAASAQEFSAEQRAACSADYNSFCKGTMPGGGRVLACLAKNTDKLSAACKKVVAEAKK